MKFEEKIIKFAKNDKIQKKLLHSGKMEKDSILGKGKVWKKHLIWEKL